jgi:hypothetical protein
MKTKKEFRLCHSSTGGCASIEATNHFWDCVEDGIWPEYEAWAENAQLWDTFRVGVSLYVERVQ